MVNSDEIRKELQKDINILKKNRESIPREELNGKYKKSYTALKNKIKDELLLYAKTVVYDQFAIPAANITQDLLQELQSLCDTFMPYAGKAAFKAMDMELVDLVVDDARSRSVGIISRHKCW